MSEDQSSTSIPSTQPQNQTIGGRSRLHCIVGRHHFGELTYEDQDQLVPGNRHVWTSKVQVNGNTYGEGKGGTKSESREQAAGKALSALQAIYGL